MDRFFRLPFTVQEDLMFFLSLWDLHSMALASKYLNSLAARAQYGKISLVSEDPNTSSRFDMRPLDTLHRRQFSFFLALAHHPEYCAFVRHLSYEFLGGCEDEEPGYLDRMNLTGRQCPYRAVKHDFIVPHCLAWKAFERFSGVVEIDLRFPSGCEKRKGKQISMPLFPTVRRARISGADFDTGNLWSVLCTSTTLISLHITERPHPAIERHVHDPRYVMLGGGEGHRQTLPLLSLVLDMRRCGHLDSLRSLIIDLEISDSCCQRIYIEMAFDMLRGLIREMDEVVLKARMGGVEDLVIDVKESVEGLDM